MRKIAFEICQNHLVLRVNYMKFLESDPQMFTSRLFEMREMSNRACSIRFGGIEEKTNHLHNAYNTYYRKTALNKLNTVEMLAHKMVYQLITIIAYIYFWTGSN